MQVADESGMRLSIKKDTKGELYVEVDSPAGISEADSPKEIVGTTKSGVALLYDLVDIRSKKIATDISETAQDRGRNIPVADNSITDSDKNVNGKDEKIFGTAKNSSNQRFALSEEISGQKIKANMSDEERYAIFGQRKYSLRRNCVREHKNERDR